LLHHPSVAGTHPLPILPPRRRTARTRSFRTAPRDHCLDDWLQRDRRLDPDHPARAIARAVHRLDCGRRGRLDAGFGSPAYPPPLLRAAALYQAPCGHHAPAPGHRHAHASDPVRGLLRGFTPAPSCWYQCRDRVGPELLGRAQQAVRDASAEGFTTATRAAVDGTALAANAGRHKLLGPTARAPRGAQLPQAVAADAVAVAAPAGPGPEAGAQPMPPAAPASAPGVDAAAPPRWLAATVRGRPRQARR
jgi:hypothetical protein